jgi:hypothetical protein
MKYIVFLLLFIGLTTANFEYLVNRQSSTMLLVIAIAIEILLIYFLIYIPLKKHLL